MIVLDASALLALFNRETGWDFVARSVASSDATISSVNYAEVLQKAARHGVPAEDVDAGLDAVGITVTPFSRLDARLAASFYRHRSGLSGAAFMPSVMRVCTKPGRTTVTPTSCGRSASVSPV